MTACNLSLHYTLAPDANVRALPPRFTFEPVAGAARQVRLEATNLRSVDRLDVQWSSSETMVDGKNPAAVALGKLGRAANTKEQQKAARANGRKGGRPVGAKDRKPRTRVAPNNQRDAARIKAARKAGWTRIDYNAGGQLIGLPPHPKSPADMQPVP